MSAHHTPGPWQAVEWSCHAKTTIRAGDATVAECGGHGRYANDCLADARLIAAAPDLLDALQDLVAMLPDPELDDDDVQKALVRNALAAIAKAGSTA